MSMATVARLTYEVHVLGFDRSGHVFAQELAARLSMSCWKGQ